MARILVVENDNDVAQLVARRLRTYQHIVFSAQNGFLAKRLIGMDRPVDVVIIDTQLPGTTGFEVVRELRRHPELSRPNLPAIFLSDSADSEDERQARELGAVCLKKPVVSGELQGAVLQAIKTDS